MQEEEKKKSEHNLLGLRLERVYNPQPTKQTDQSYEVMIFVIIVCYMSFVNSSLQVW